LLSGKASKYRSKGALGHLTGPSAWCSEGKKKNAIAMRYCIYSLHCGGGKVGEYGNAPERSGIEVDSWKLVPREGWFRGATG
jgi:hypothetical protein